ncbi:hypothetical protein BGW38_010040, partial [Lunasporangiospora selenospora]
KYQNVRKLQDIDWEVENLNDLQAVKDKSVKIPFTDAAVKEQALAAPFTDVGIIKETSTRSRQDRSCLA